MRFTETQCDETSAKQKTKENIKREQKPPLGDVDAGEEDDGGQFGEPVCTERNITSSDIST